MTAILGLRPGDIIDGRLEIESLIGHGGQGVVLRVNHLEWNRALALKLPLPDAVNSPSKRDRFLQEAETWIRLGVHPNVVRCWFVKQISGLPGLFLDFISGGSLEDKMEDGTVGPGQWNRIISIVCQVAEGLAHSHSMGVIHRDIKPENLLIRKNGQVCLTDFGLVKSIEQEDTEGQGRLSDTASTGAGEVLGTPRYGAPEQWNKTKSIAPQTDIYALGVLFFEMLCGRRPYDGPGEERMNPYDLVRRHLHDAIPDPRKFRPDVPEVLAQLAMKCLSKEPAGRPGSAIELIGLLQNIQQQIGQSGHQRPAPIPGGDRPDLLNNAAVSLYSLGQTEKCRELLEKALLIQAGHPESVYNLVQLDRREGKITATESLHQVRRAKARFQLALLLIEEGLGKQAIDLLDSFQESEVNGLTHRTKGDAYMYAKQYLAAQRAYDKAKKFMPNDQPTRMRKVLAAQGQRGMHGHLFFPASVSCYQNRAPHHELELLLTDDSQNLIGVNAKELVILNVDSQSALDHQNRPEQASTPRRSWIHQEKLLVQDGGGFELWRLDELQLLQRAEGRVLAATLDLKRLALLTRNGVMLLDKVTNQSGQLQFPPGTTPSAHVKALFTADGKGLGVITPDGRLAQVDENYNVIPLAWPPAIPNLESIIDIQFGPRGGLYIAYREGRIQALDLASSSLKFQVDVPFYPRRLMIDRGGQTVVVSSPGQFGVFSSRGELLFKGLGPCCMDSTGRFALAWVQGSLTLFETSPFRRVRSWTEKIPQPISLNFGKDGRRAVSLAASGEHHVWEVDEQNRVFERSLLLTPGASYEQLIQSFNVYSQSFQRAVKDFRSNSAKSSYQFLSQARRVSGFSQAEEALELQWELSHKLLRGSLEANWERVYTDGVSYFHLHQEVPVLLTTSGRDWSLLNLQISSQAHQASGQVESNILACHCHIFDGTQQIVLLCTKAGQLEAYKAKDGSHFSTLDLGIGPLVKAKFFNQTLFAQSPNGEWSRVDIPSLKVTGSGALHLEADSRLHHLDQRRLLLCDSQGWQTYDLNKSRSHPKLPFKLALQQTKLTYAAFSASFGLFKVGLNDGSVAVFNESGKAIVFSLKLPIGAIHGFEISSHLSLGVAAGSKGQLALFDLKTGALLEKFHAHTAPVTELQITADGRYLAARSARGRLRVFELSWHLEQSGQNSVKWLPKTTLGKIGKFFKKPIF